MSPMSYNRRGVCGGRMFCLETDGKALKLLSVLIISSLAVNNSAAAEKLKF